MDEKQKEDLNRRVQIAGIMREFLQHPGFLIWKGELDRKMGDLKNEWFRVAPEQGEKIKLRAQVYNEMLDILKAKIVEGDMALKAIREFEEVE